MKKKRVDSLIVEQGLAASLEEARILILAGTVYTKDQAIRSSSTLLPIDTLLQVKAKKTEGYLGRGYLKLKGAIEDLQLQEAFRDKVVLDIGASTGGFVQCVLEYGAKHVLALDVGHNQLAWALRQDSRVLSLEGTGIKAFKPHKYEPVDWILADISFNSLARLSPAILQSSSAEQACFLLLVKPQFELNRAEIPAGGVVMDPELQQKAVQQVIQAFAALELEVLGQTPSRVVGQKGNQEIFLLLKRKIPT